MLSSSYSSAVRVYPRVQTLLRNNNRPGTTLNRFNPAIRFLSHTNAPIRTGRYQAAQALGTLKSDRLLSLSNLIKVIVFRPTTGGGILFASAFAFMDKEADNFKGVSLETLKKADALFDEGHYDQLIELLKSQTGWYDNEQILWRVARCEYTQSKAIKDQKDKYEELLNNAYLHVQHSLELDDKNGLAHKWAAILLDAVSTMKGQKERVLQVLNVRTHMEKAIEYAPTDPTSFYLLGEWHYSCFQVTWWERKIASIAFGSLPDADIETALKMFEKAEEIEKDFYSKNKVMIAKTLFQLKREKDRALSLLKEVIDKYSSAEKWDDKEAVEEATKLLKQYS